MNVPYRNEHAATQEHRIEMLVVGFIMISIIEAEAATTLVAPLIGIILHSAIILTIVNIYLLIPFLPHRKVLLALLLLPILRMISLTVPIAQLPQLYWYAATGGPLLISTILVIRLIQPAYNPFYVRIDRAWMQVAFGLIGIPLGVVAYRFFPPKLFINPTDWMEIAIGIASLIVFSALTDELIFRHLIQSNLEDVFGRWGIWFGAILYAGLFISTMSLSAVIFWGLVGLGFGFWVKWTHSIWGTIFAHSLILVGGLIIFPLILL